MSAIRPDACPCCGYKGPSPVTRQTVTWDDVDDPSCDMASWKSLPRICYCSVADCWCEHQHSLLRFNHLGRDFEGLRFLDILQMPSDVYSAVEKARIHLQMDRFPAPSRRGFDEFNSLIRDTFGDHQRRIPASLIVAEWEARTPEYRGRLEDLAANRVIVEEVKKIRTHLYANPDLWPRGLTENAFTSWFNSGCDFIIPPC